MNINSRMQQDYSKPKDLDKLEFLEKISELIDFIEESYQRKDWGTTANVVCSLVFLTIATE